MRGSIAPIAILLVLAVIGAIVLFSFPYNPTHPPRANETGSTPEGIKAVIAGNNKFAIELYKQLESKNENIFFSPYSIHSAMALVYEGSGGKTAAELKEGMNYPDLEILEPNFAALYNKINSGSTEYELRTGNALWVQKDFPLLEDYKKRAEEYYGAKAAEVDFVNESEKSLQTINQFIQEQTNGKIRNILTPSDINSLTRLVITNAIYFKGTWRWQFNKEKTRDMPFYVTREKKVMVKMMEMKPEKARFNYADLEKMQILELPYKGNLSMVIILPKQGHFFNPETGEKSYNYTLEDIEKDLTWGNLENWLSRMKKEKISEIYLPRFKLETKYDLRDYLEGLGIKDAFNQTKADLSRMSKKPLYVQKAIHKAYVDVNEEGTEAAAATAVVVGLTAVGQENIFMADHPFIFLIRDNETGAILFMGRLVDPTSAS